MVENHNTYGQLIGGDVLVSLIAGLVSSTGLSSVLKERRSSLLPLMPVRLSHDRMGDTATIL